MKKYRFSLDAVLRVRRAQEDLLRLRMAEQTRRAAQSRAALDDRLRAAADMSGSTGNMTRSSFIALRAQEDRAAESVAAARHRVSEAEVAVASCYAALVEQKKRVAAIEHLDQSRREEWRQEAAREEAVMVDDIVASRWIVASESSPI